MGWRGLLRVVDFQALLSSQPVVAAALEKAQMAAATTGCEDSRAWKSTTRRRPRHPMRPAKSRIEKRVSTSVD